MRLEQATHILESNRAKMRMSEFTEEIPIQIAAGINRLGDGEYTYYSIYPVGAEVPYDEFPYSHEWIQATGIAPDRLTVEIKQRDANGVHRLYTIGRPGGAGESAETEPIQNGDNTYLIRPAEVLAATDAIALFQHYYDTHTVPEAWSLREQPEFSDTAVAEQYGEGEQCPPETRLP
ncbi:hypothetical protein NCCNTM_46860 [Mycolicibacterium sp. NCC-Tsukiji]|uniref:hypothetical protein n=2 Tax=Mycobacteriaceae TaxID=1762 RepID=UPI00076A20B0|nr:hypothetical protein [Mycolicibacterium mucogenicum]GCB01052.1 hypothetical protein NCCNTM_46860 [Mycolicibacterium sp. NCC-Tsukiji]